jgi:hypothetical protein
MTYKCRNNECFSSEARSPCFANVANAKVKPRRMYVCITMYVGNKCYLLLFLRNENEKLFSFLEHALHMG